MNTTNSLRGQTIASAAAASDTRASEIDTEIARLREVTGHVENLFGDLAGRIAPVRADEPPSIGKGTEPVESVPMTALGQQIREITARVEAMRSGLHYQLRTVAL